jgi:tRNA (guanosine-2'-O-)-methyltransferase
MTPERFRTLRAVLARRQPDLTVLAEDVHKPHNVAALLRTCDAVGALELHAVSSRGSFDRPRIITGGTRDWVPARTHPSIEAAVSHLKSNNFQIVAAHFSESSQDYRSLDYTRPTAFLMGSELMGVSARAAALADQHVVIPMRGLVESLNVSVAAALLLYEAARQREVAGLYDTVRLAPERFDALLFEWCYPRIAARCRDRGVPYPTLDEDGRLSHNPLTGLPPRN